MKLKSLLGIAVIILGLFIEIVWLGVCFGTVFIGILLLIFAPSILFFPFNFFLMLGLSIIGARTYKTNFRYQEYTYNDNNPRYHEPFNNNLNEYYQTLESSPHDSLDTIKANYRRLMKEYHYDSIASKDLPDDMVKFANEKTQQLNEAYAKIKEIRK